MANNYTGKGIMVPYISVKDGVNIVNNITPDNLQSISKKDEVNVIDDKMRIAYGIEIPLSPLRDAQLSDPNDTPKLLFKCVREHKKGERPYRRKAYDTLKSSVGDCIDKTAIGIAIARNNGFQARAPGRRTGLYPGGAGCPDRTAARGSGPGSRAPGV